MVTWVPFALRRARRIIRGEWAKVFATVDCLVTPTTPVTATKFGEEKAALPGGDKPLVRAYLDLTLPVVRYRTAGIHQGPDGRVVAPNHVIAKVSRVEVAGRFFTRRSYVTPAALAGLPAIAVPCGFTGSGLPLSLQLIGRHFEEATVLRAAHAYERGSEWSRRRPPATT